MKISTRGRYGLRAMLELAASDPKKPLSIQMIAQRQDISDKYLEHIFQLLRNAGLVKSIRGAHGGYVLGRKPDSITVGQILRAIEGSLSPVECISTSPAEECDRIENCTARHIWKYISERINSAVDGITLSDLIDEEKKAFKKKAN